MSLQLKAFSIEFDNFYRGRSQNIPFTFFKFKITNLITG